jgi:hypothetical protein
MESRKTIVEQFKDVKRKPVEVAFSNPERR